MAIDLPWFKFYADEWLTGHITLEDELLQGVFITICAYYWKLDGNLNLDTLKRRYRHISGDIWEELIKKNFLKKGSENQINISFLDEQLKSRKNQSEINKRNGSKGGKAKAAAKRSLSEKVANAKQKGSNIEEKRREEEENKSKTLKGSDVYRVCWGLEISKTQCNKLAKDFNVDKKVIDDKLDYFANTKSYKNKYVDLYRVIRNWLRLSSEKNSPTVKSSPFDGLQDLTKVNL